MDHTSCRLRLAAIADAPAILEIYAQYMDTPITFETELPSLEEFEGRIRTITYVLVLMVLSLLAIYLSGLNGNTFLFRAGICLIGFSYGSFMGIYPAFTSDQFGVKYSALNYGILFIGFSLAGVVGPLIMQKIFSEFASYRPSFPIAIVFALIGIALTFLYRAVNRKLAQKSA